MMRCGSCCEKNKIRSHAESYPPRPNRLPVAYQRVLLGGMGCFNDCDCRGGTPWPPLSSASTPTFVTGSCHLSFNARSNERGGHGVPPLHLNLSGGKPPFLTCSLLCLEW